MKGINDMQPPNSEIPEINLVLREGPNGDLGVQIYDLTDSKSPLTLLAAGLIAELQNNPNRILDSGDAAFRLWKTPYEKGAS